MQPLTDGRPIVSFLYELMRDHLPSSPVETVVRNSEDVNPLFPCEMTNGFLAAYAQELADRLGRANRPMVPLNIQRALEHVREHHPEVTMVLFADDTRWRYMTDDFEAPKFGKNIETSILEDAVYDLVHLPAVYHINDIKQS